MNIRPVSDLRNKFTEIESIVQEGQPVYLTKNGYGTMVVLSLAQYSAMTDTIETRLDEAEYQAANTSQRLSHDEVFSRARSVIHGN